MYRVRTVHRFMETLNGSNSLFDRVFFTRTGIHFARKRSRRCLHRAGLGAKLPPKFKSERLLRMTSIQRFAMDGPVLIRPKLHGDERGYFFEAFRQDWFEREIAAGVAFVQDN